MAAREAMGSSLLAVRVGSAARVRSAPPRADAASCPGRERRSCRTGIRGFEKPEV
jgi:hypothetical protein